MISVPASRSISPTISSVYFFSAKITSVPGKGVYITSSFERLLAVCIRNRRASRNGNGCRDEARSHCGDLFTSRVFEVSPRGRSSDQASRYDS